MKQLISLCFIFACFATHAQDLLPKWTPGLLDIHFISTGSGNCAFIVMPDGTSMLVDAGELDPTSPRVLSPRNTPRFPNYSKLGYEWQADYIQGVLPPNCQGKIDYALITHFHDDHFGDIYPGVPHSTKGEYSLSGITGVGELIGIRRLIDRGWNYPTDLRAASKNKSHLASLANYFSFVDWAMTNESMTYQPFEVGSQQQFAMQYTPNQYPSFVIENIQANGAVMKDGELSTRMPKVGEFAAKGTPGENHLSTGIMLRYGGFKCYLGGDIPGSAPDYERAPEWHDVESWVAPVVGEVDVTTTNHHANRDAMTPFYLSILKPRVILQEVWSSDHPGHEALKRMTSQNIWTGERDLFSTAMLEANRLVIGELIEESYRSMNGHIVLRVEPKGEQYSIYVLNNMSTSKHVTGQFGPYKTKIK